MTLLLLLLTLVAQAQAPPRDARTAAVVGSGAIAGVVLSDETTPRPLRHAQVTVSGAAMGMARTVITADNGSFTVPDLRPGAYDLSANKGAYVTMYYGAVRPGLRGRALVVKAGETAPVTIRLPRGAVITGTVTDPDGQPAQGIEVSVQQRRAFFGGYRYVSAGATALPTDDRGVYRVYGLPAGVYVVSVQPAARDRLRSTGSVERTLVAAQVFYPSVVDPSRATRVVVGRGEERSGIDIQLQYVPVAAVSGTVAIPTGWDAGEASLAPVDESSGPVTSSGTRTDVAGRFSFANVPPGSYRLFARIHDGPDVLTGAIDVAVNGEDVDNLTLGMQPPVTVKGVMLFRGESAPPLSVSSSDMRPLAILPMNYESLTPLLRMDGVRLTFTGVTPGALRLTSSLQGVRSPIGKWWMTSVVANGVDLLDGAEVRDSIDNAVATFSDRASELSGVVSSAGAPLGEATVIAFAVDRAAWFPGSRRVVDARTDADGRYSIRNLPPGQYYVVATTQMERGEWFEAGALDRLLPGAAAIAIEDTVAKRLDLSVR